MTLFVRWGLVALILIGQVWAHAETLILVSGDDYVPYADSKLPGGGMATEIVTKAFARAKMSVQVQWRPWARGYLETKMGRFAATYPYAKSDKREADFLYSEPIIKVTAHAWTKPANAGKYDFSRPASLEGSVLCQPLGYITPPKLAGLIDDGRIKKVSPPEMTTCVRLVIAGAADFLVTPQSNGEGTLQAVGLPRDALTMDEAAPLFETRLYLIASRVSPRSAATLASFNHGLELLHQSGDYDKIVKKYGH
jgi:polar amino acid transport system substrate-binding protein